MKKAEARAIHLGYNKKGFNCVSIEGVEISHLIRGVRVWHKKGKRLAFLLELLPEETALIHNRSPIQRLGKKARKSRRG